MKYFRHILLLFVCLCTYSTFSQEAFDNGKIRVRVDTYGAIRLSTILGADTLQQLNRASFLAAGNPLQVLDYYNDLNVDTATTLVISPKVSDFEISGTYNNTYSNLPPNFLVQQNVYGWNNEKFTLIKNRIINKEIVNTPCRPGFDIIQHLDGTFENDTIFYDAANKMLVQYENHWVGIKMLSEAFEAAKFDIWYKGYTNDTKYYNLMQPGFSNGMLVTDANGGYGVISGSRASLAPNAERTVFLAIVVGDNKAEMMTNLTKAVQKYNTLVGIKSESNIIPSEFVLNQNYPNPFNPTTSISFTLPHRSFVSLKVYDVLGKEVANLVGRVLDAGLHVVGLNALSLPSGTYFYTIKADGNMLSKKMMLVK